MLPSDPAASEPLTTALLRLYDACAADDASMSKGPWIFDDKETRIVGAERGTIVSGGAVGYENAQLTISDEDAAGIVAGRNRLGDLAKHLSQAARRINLLENLAIQDSAARDRIRSGHLADFQALQRLYKESRDYVAELLREREHYLRAISRLQAVVDAVSDADILALPPEVRDARLAYEHPAEEPA